MVSGDVFGAFLDQLAQAGFFDYVLPFLLIFSLIYGVLLKTKVFEENKSINGIISLAVALLALQFDFVPNFFSQVFPLLGVGLGVILVIIILLGLFMPVNQQWVSYSLLAIGAIIVWTVLSKSGLFVGAESSGIVMWLSQNWPVIVGLIFLLAVIGIIVREGKSKEPKPKIPLLKPFWGESGKE